MPDTMDIQDVIPYQTQEAGPSDLQSAIDNLRVNLGVAENPEEQAMSHLRLGHAPEDAQAALERNFPGSSRSVMPQYQAAFQHQQQENRLNQMRQSLSGAQENWTSYLLRPFGAAIDSWRAAQAQTRYLQGTASDGDLSLIAQQERLNQLQGAESTGRAVYRGLAQIPKILVEAYVGGWALRGLAATGALSTTAGIAGGGGAAGYLTRTAIGLSPFIGEQAAEGAGQRAFQTGTAPTDIRNLAPSTTLAVLNAAVLGSMGHVAEGIPGASVGRFLERAATRVGVGMAEQQAVDAISSLTGLQTGYGVLGSAFQGKWGDFWRELAVQSATFSAFGAFHEATQGAPTIPGTIPDAMKFLGRQGMTRDQAGKVLYNLNERIMSGMTGADVERMPDSPIKNYARAIVNVTDVLRNELAQRQLPPTQQTVPFSREGMAVPPGRYHGLEGLAVPPNEGMAVPPGQELPSREGLAVPPSGPLEGSPEAPTPLNAQQVTQGPQNAPTGQPSLLERMRARQQAQGQLPVGDVPHPGGPPRPVRDLETPQGKPTLESLTRAYQGDAFADEAQRAGLTPLESAVMQKLFEGERSFTDMAKDPQLKVLAAKEGLAWNFKQQADKAMRRAMFKIGETGTFEQNIDRLNHLRQVSEQQAAQTNLEGEHLTITGDGQIRVVHAQETPDITGMKREGIQSETQSERDFTDNALSAHWEHAEDVIKNGANADVFDAFVQGRTEREAAFRTKLEKKFPDLNDADLEQKLQTKMDNYNRAKLARSFPLLDNDAVKRLDEILKEAGYEYARLEPDDKEAFRRTILASLPESARSNEVNASDQGGPRVRPGEGPADQGRGPAAVPEANDNANPPAAPPRGQAGGNELGFGATVSRIVNDFVKDNQGTLWVPDAQTIKEFGQKLWERMTTGVRHLDHNFREMGSSMFPRMADAEGLRPESGKEVSYRMGIAAGAKPAALTELPRDIRNITGGAELTQEQRNLYGSALLEKYRLERAKEFYHDQEIKFWNEAQTATTPEAKAAWIAKSAEMSNAGRNVGTLVGKPDSPLTDRAAYRRTLADPLFQNIEKNWRPFSDEMDDFYRVAKGMAPGSPMPENTQTRGMTMKLRDTPLEEDNSIVSTRGAARVSKPGMAKQTTGTGQNYETDLYKIIENTRVEHMQYAANQQMYRAAFAEGVGIWGKPRETTGAYAGSTEFKGVRPEAGLQADEAGQTSFYIKDPRAAVDWKKMVDTETANKFETIEGFAKAVTAANLCTGAEVLPHVGNLMMAAFNHGMFRGIWRTMAMTAEAKEARIVELTKMGVSRPLPRELLTGAEGAKIFDILKKPSDFFGKGMEYVRDNMMLAADKSFDLMAKEGLVEDTGYNRREYINRCVFQYNMKAQNKLTQLLRDSGIGPFATAGFGAFGAAKRALTGSHGIEATSLGADIQLRAWKIAKIWGLVGAMAGANFLMWGNPFGDDDTPMGALKIGTDTNGKTQYLDPIAWTGLRRGARELGALAVAEGIRRGRPAGAIVDQGVQNMGDAFMHSMEGPPVQFLHTFFTGRNYAGTQVTPQHADSATWENTKAAFLNAIPLVGELTGANRGPNAPAPSWLEFGEHLARPFGPQAADPMSRYQQEVHDLTNARDAFRSQNQGMRFPQEAQFQRLNAFHHSIDVLNRAMRTAPPDQRQIYRQRMIQLAQRALGTG